MQQHAVITGDIVNSTTLNSPKEKKLIHALETLFEEQECKAEFFRGDSFQVYSKQAADSLRLALLARALTMGLFKDSDTGIDIRMAIGIGEVVSPVRILGAAKGEAFLLSGRQFDTIAKSNRRLVIATTNPLANEGLEVIAAYTDIIFAAMTGKQADVIYRLLQRQKQQDIAHKLKKTKSTVHQLLTSGRWAEIETNLEHYGNIINLLK